jgi:hypothetical protein
MINMHPGAVPGRKCDFNTVDDTTSRGRLTTMCERQLRLGQRNEGCQDNKDGSEARDHCRRHCWT